MSIYLHDIPLTEAKSIFSQKLKSAGLSGILAQEELTIDEQLLGRTLVDSVWAKISSPHYHAAAMDGFAIHTRQIIQAIPSKPVLLKNGAGLQATYVDTGDPLPEWANAVIPIEDVETIRPDGTIGSMVRQPEAIRVRQSIAPWSHVRPMGEDIVATQLVLPAGKILRAVDLGAIVASGYDKVSVSRKPRVGILPTGTELVNPGSDLEQGDIIEYNSIILAAKVNEWGGQAIRYPITPDNFEMLVNQTKLAAQECDLILINAGSSAGSEDFSVKVIETLGEVYVHGVAIRPGHPVILGLLDKCKNGTMNKPVPIIGVPGYPVSAALCAELFVEPLLAEWLGKRPLEMDEIDAQISRKISSYGGDDDFIRVVIGKVGQKIIAAPLARGAGLVTSLVQADGVTIIPRQIQGLEAGEKVTVRLYNKTKEIDKTILVIGSHDITLDLLSHALTPFNRRLVTANVGSQAGLLALQRHVAHITGSHLLDPETGEYNTAAIKKYLEGTPVSVISWVGRQQGLIIKSENPKKIASLQDLLREDVQYINRQRGSGTRVLLDYYLSLANIPTEKINGYDDEEYTHLSVAAAVISGKADCGLGIASAASALHLGFIPLYNEIYELVIPEEFRGSYLLEPLFELMLDSHFKKQISALPGYDIDCMGKERIIK